MKKFRLVISGLLASAVASVSAGIGAVTAFGAEPESVSMTQIASYIHENAAYETGCSSDTADYFLKWGNYTDLSALENFSQSNEQSVYKYDGDEKIDCFFYYAGDNAGKISAGAAGKETVLVVTAKANMALTLETAAFNTTANNLIVRSVVSDGTTDKVLGKISCGARDTAIAENALGGTYHLQTGDSFYFVVGSTNEYTIRNNAIAPVFSSDTDAYLQSVRDSYYIETVSASEIAGYVAENQAYESGLQTEEADYFLRYGDAGTLAEMQMFSLSNEESVYAYDGTERIDCFFYYAGENAGKISAGKAGYESAIGVKANVDTAITVYNDAFATTANNLMVNTFILNGERIYAAKSVAGGARDTQIAANALGGTYHLKAGDTLYFVVSSTNDYTIRLNAIHARFSSDPDGYSEEERAKYFPEIAEDNEVDAAEIAGYVSTYLTYDEGYETTNALYALRWGNAEDLSALHAFDKANEISVYEYNAESKIDCFFYYATNESFNAGMISAGQKGYETVIEVTAKENFALTAGNRAFSTPANNLVVRTYVTNGVTLVKTGEHTGYATGTQIAENALGGTYHLKAGDTFYFVIGATNEYPIRKLDINPIFTVNEAGYSEDARTEIYEVQEAIPAKIAELRAYFESLDESLYTAANVLQMDGYVDEFAGQAALVGTLDELNALYEEYRQKIDDVMTIEETAADLAAYQTEKLAELEELYNTFLSENAYDEAGEQALKEAFDGAKTNIENATSKNMINTALAAARNAMERVEPKTGSGCGSALGAIVPLAGFAAACLRFRRRKTGNRV